MFHWIVYSVSMNQHLLWYNKKILQENKEKEAQMCEMCEHVITHLQLLFLCCIVWYGIVLSYRLAEVHWLTFITESAEVRVNHYYALAGAIYLGTYFTGFHDILGTFFSCQGITEWHLIYLGTYSAPPLHCTMGQAVEIDILEVHKSKKLLHAHLWSENVHSLC